MGCEELTIDYILVNPKDSKHVLVCLSDTYGEESYLYKPYQKDETRNMMFSDYGEFFFDLLNEYDIVKISLDTHQTLWNYIEEMYEDLQEMPENSNKYLLYCKKKFITLIRLKRTNNILQFLKYNSKEEKF